MTRDSAPPRHRDRRGFALPIVLLVTLMISTTLAAGFVLTAAEHAVGTDHDAQLQAYTVTQIGLERYLTDVTALPSTFPNVRTTAVPGGVATVTLHRMRAASATDSAIYVLTSVGRATTNSLRRSSLTPVAERTVSQFASWQSGTIDADAAFTTLSGANVKNGSSGTVSGNDACPGSSQPAIPGLALPDASLDMNGHNTNFIDGDPDNAPVYIGTAGPSGTAKDSVDIDWAGILAGSIAPDYTLNRYLGKNVGGKFADINFTNWPVVLVKGDITNTDNTNKGDGYGVLLVTGDADLSNITWHGIVLIGGAVTLSGSATNVYGAMITGLNVKLGMTVGPSEVGNGAVNVRYQSCDIANALLKFGGWRRYANTWSDNWPSYTMP